MIELKNRGVYLGTMDFSKVFNELDRDKSGEVDCEEFLEAALNRKEIMNKSNVELLFNSIVRDGLDYITKADLKNAL